MNFKLIYKCYYVPVNLYIKTSSKDEPLEPPKIIKLFTVSVD